MIEVVIRLHVSNRSGVRRLVEGFRSQAQGRPDMTGLGSKNTLKRFASLCPRAFHVNDLPEPPNLMDQSPVSMAEFPGAGLDGPTGTSLSIIMT
jgi:hypothetical protein